MLTTHPLAAAVLQQEAGEPVAWQYLSDHEGWKFVCNERRDVLKRARYQIRPLYATPQVSPPQARVPLTMNQVWANDEIMSLNAEIGFPMPFLMRTVRAIERAHLIGLETKE